MKPDFIIAGFPRCGTITLYGYLGQHPRIYAHGKTDIWFFKTEELWNKGLDWYQSQFASNDLLQGDATAHYFYPEAMERILTAFPHTKIFFVLRNPVNRAFSHYWRRILKNKTSETAEQTILAEGKIEPKSTGQIFKTGQYVNYLRNYYDLPNVKIVIFEKANQDWAKVMAGIWDFMELEPVKTTPLPKLNPGKYLRYVKLRRLTLPKLQGTINRIPLLWTTAEPERNPYLVRLLANMYEPSIVMLEDLLKEDLSIWRQHEDKVRRSNKTR